MNEGLDRALLNLVQKKKRIRMTLIPSSSEVGEEAFEEIKDYYSGYGIKDFTYFPIDREFTQKGLEKVLKSDVIYLSGGNTFYFLKHLQKSGVAALLRSFVKRGGVLVGESAGSIVMTPEIRTASFPYFDRDDNDVNLRDWKALSLVNFEFFPHYKSSKRYDRILSRHSKRSKSRPIYACPDGSGIILKNGKLEFQGKVYGFLNGEKFRVQ